MLRAAIITAGVLALTFAAGCYETPMPECSFQCAADSTCPTGYSCSSVDNICKRNGVAEDFVCPGIVLADAAVQLPDAAVNDAAVIDASFIDASTPDAPVPDAMVPDAMVPDAFVPDAMPVCGNGVTESGETCDDFNDNNCGSCNLGCGTIQTPTAATGSITTVIAANINDTETFTIDDGINAAVVFEFDKTAAATDVPVDISGATTADDVKTAIITAITNSNTAGDLAVTASDGGAGIVTLTHDRNTSLGNQAVVEGVADAGFAVSGLSGGVAGDCPATTGCNVPDDCASGSCTSNQCD